jgi:hypothetical protein
LATDSSTSLPVDVGQLDPQPTGLQIERPCSERQRPRARTSASASPPRPPTAPTGANHLLTSDVLRRHELQVWFLVDTPITRALRHVSAVRGSPGCARPLR